MAKATFGEYAGYTTPGGIRYQYKNKLTSSKAIPPEVVSFLENKLLGQPRGFKKPTPEELAKIRAEQLAPKPGLEADPQKLADDAANAADRLTSQDFDEPPVPVDPSPPEEVPEGEDFTPVSVPKPEIDPDFLEQVSIHTASLDDLVEALYNRFGIYTVYLRKLPVSDEVNPLTGAQFTKYHLGIAYQAAIFAKNKGLLNVPGEQNRKTMDANREAHENLPLDTPPQTFGAARRANSFDFRTSARGNDAEPTTEIVHIKDENGIIKAVQRVIPAGEVGSGNGAAQRYDKEEDEPIVEPRFGKQVIRPEW